MERFGYYQGTFCRIRASWQLCPTCRSTVQGMVAPFKHGALFKVVSLPIWNIIGPPLNIPMTTFLSGSLPTTSVALPCPCKSWVLLYTLQLTQAEERMWCACVPKSFQGLKATCHRVTCESSGWLRSLHSPTTPLRDETPLYGLKP